MFTSIAAPKLNSERGFLPLQDPLGHLPAPFAAWESAASSLPKLLVSDHCRRALENLPPFPLEALSNPRERERAMLLLSYLGHAYVWGGTEPAAVLPARLAIPWHAVATALGRPPVLSYSTYALHNFFRFQPERDIECGNIGLLQNFLAGLDEEWFILIHVQIERQAAPALAACTSASMPAKRARPSASKPPSQTCTPLLTPCLPPSSG